MNKWSKLAQFVTLISTFIALGAVLFLLLNKEEEAFPSEKFNEVVAEQTKQREDIVVIKTDMDGKLDTQNKVLLEFDKRIDQVEETQTEFLTIMAETEKKAETKPTTPVKTPVKAPVKTPVKEAVKTPAHVLVKSSDGLHLRTKASDDSNSLGVLVNGTKLTVIGGPESSSKYEWYKVKTARGTVGWVAIKFVQ